MKKLRVPSLQHLARNCLRDPQQIRQRLVNLAENGPTFSYDRLFSAIIDMVLLGIPYDQVVEGIRRGIAREDVRDNFLGVLPLIHDYFKNVSPNFVQGVDRRFYPVSRNLIVPFCPPLIYGTGGQIHFPWFSFWRSNPLANERLSLFVSMVEDVLLQDPDLEGAKFTILDFSAPSPKRERELTITDVRDIPRISEETKIEMLSEFAEGFRLARAELAGNAEAEPKHEQQDDADKQNQPGLFDDDR